MENKTIAPSIRQLIIRDLGKFGGYSGVNKLFYLVSAIDTLIEHIGERAVIERVNLELEKLESFRIEKGISTMVKVKNWNEIEKIISDLRPKLAQIQFAYDDIRDKEFRNKRETDSKINYKKLTRKVSPYQPEIYFLFNILMEMSNMQYQTISPEAFKTPQIAGMTKTPFVKPTPIKPQEQQGIV